MRAALVLLALLIGSSAFSGTRADIERQYKAWARAAMSNDADAVLKILTSDYVLVTYAGDTVSLDTYAKTLRKRKEEGKPAQKYTTKLVKLTEMDGEAEAISDETYLSDVVDDKTGQKMRMRHTHRYRDTWVKTAVGWKLRKTFTENETTSYERR